MSRPNSPEPIRGMRLAQDENVIATLEVRASLVFPHTTSFAVTDRRFGGDYRTGMFSSEQFQFPLTNIASVGVGTRVSKVLFIVGAIVALISVVHLLFTLGDPGLGTLLDLVFLVLGGFWLVSSFKAEAQVTNNAGQTLSCRMNLFEKARAAEFFSEVSREIAEANYGTR